MFHKPWAICWRLIAAPECQSSDSFLERKLISYIVSFCIFFPTVPVEVLLFWFCLRLSCFVYTNFDQIPYLQSQHKIQLYHFLKVFIWPGSELQGLLSLDWENFFQSSVSLLEIQLFHCQKTLINLLLWQEFSIKIALLAGIILSSKTGPWIVSSIPAISSFYLAIYFTSLPFLEKLFVYAGKTASEDFIRLLP